MHVRRFLPGDAAALLALFRDTVRRVNSRDYSPEQVRAWAPAQIEPKAWAEQLAGRFTVVAEDAGTLVGFGELEGDGHINRFYAHADFQNQGIGRTMLEAIEAEARKHGIARLFTEASITARPFFQRRGFLVLAEQTVERRGVSFINYRMEKHLQTLGAAEPAKDPTGCG